MSDSQHSMITRSKKEQLKLTTFPENTDPPNNSDEDIDEKGNLKGLIDYDCNEEFDSEMFQKELKRLRGGKMHQFHSSPKKRKTKKIDSLFSDLSFIRTLSTRTAN